MTLITKSRTRDFTPASPEIYFTSTFGKYFIYFKVYNDNGTTRGMIPYPEDKLIIDNKTFIVPDFETREELSEFTNTLKIHLHNEYIGQAIDNL